MKDRQFLRTVHAALIEYQRQCAEPSDSVARVVLVVEEELQRPWPLPLDDRFCFIHVRCPLCGSGDYHRPSGGYVCRSCGELVKPTIPHQESLPILLMEILRKAGLVEEEQRTWAEWFYKKDPDAFWRYIKIQIRKGEKK